MFTDTARNAIHRAALNLVTEAQRAGVVVTIETTPHQPLAMGNHDMSVTVRDARRPPPFAVSYGVRLGTELQGIVGTAMFQARRLVEGEGQSKSDLLETLHVLDHAVRHGLVSLAAPEVVDCARELHALRKKVATYEARDALGLVPKADTAFPMQPVEIAADGVVRFRKNRLVSDLCDNAQLTGFGANERAMGDYTAEEHMQFAQLTGYSVSGYGDLDYASKDSIARADAIAAALVAARGA